MGKCKLCNRSGIFLSITSNGLCKKCDPVFYLDFKQRARIINESMNLVEDSKKLETRINRCQDIVEHANSLLEYEKRGIPTIQPLPSELIDIYENKPDELIKETLQIDWEKTVQKVNVPSTAKVKINHLSKLLLRIGDLKNEVNNPSYLIELEDTINSKIRAIQFDELMDEAKKAEFKGQYKKAIDKYYDVLYFLKNEEIDDAKQSNQIKEIESKIKELDEKIK
ncbi:hypothetical protein KKA00_05440 [bacterium]|nr:hypothetical protein [bacterium]MBU1651640.1 hypothetical protein [bacterium]MBU1882249.1 hypothetical protein [bacterium]